MDMARAPGFTTKRLGHEGNTLSVKICDVLRTMLEDRMAIGHRERVGISDVDLVLAAAPFAFGVFDRNAGSDHLIPHVAQRRFVAAGLEDMVVYPVTAGWSQV